MNDDVGQRESWDVWSWADFRRAHLHDYSPAAIRFWSNLVLIGAMALALAGVHLAQLPARDLWQILGWSSIAAIAAAFPIQIPGSKHSIATGDVVIFLLLAQYGTAAAVIAASLEAAIAASRSSSRRSSHLASPCAAAVAMTIGGALFEAAEPWLESTHGIPRAAAHLAALAVGVLAYFVVSTTALMQIVCLKRGKRLTPREWFHSTSWIGSMYLVSAAFAGILSLNAQQFGRAAIVVSVLVIGGSLGLLRACFRHRIAEDEAQQARVAAAELEAQQNQKRFHSAFTQASIGMAIVSPQGIVLQTNQALRTLLGFDEAQLFRLALCDLLHSNDAELLSRHMTDLTERRRDTFSIELRFLGADQREIWVAVHCARFDDRDTANAGLIFQLHDITSQQRAEELRHIAYHDALTGLANRNCFQERLSVAAARSHLDRRYNFAVMYLDLDRFKAVNDSLGHAAGDELLKYAAARLVACVRPKDLVARIGGDEFAILVDGIDQGSEVEKLGQRLLRALEQPVCINGTELRPLASIGITFSDPSSRGPEEMLRDADLAMYKAKAAGKGCAALFDVSLHAPLGDKLHLEADLRRAIAARELTLEFQPLYDLDPYRLNGFEALARWTHPTRGEIAPSVFIALAEETGCIEAITAWAIEEAVRQLATWQREAPHLDNLAMHVNVSGRDLALSHLVPHVRTVLRRYRLPAHRLMLEITESVLMEHREWAQRSLAELRELGVKLSIDDFGTGYSSLAHLSTLPFDCLKIDRSFVIGMDENPQNIEIVRAVLSLGVSLKKLVIAEGIETQDQLQRLKQLGVPVGQGYLLARPLRAPEVRKLLLGHKLLPELV